MVADAASEVYSLRVASRTIREFGAVHSGEHRRPWHALRQRAIRGYAYQLLAGRSRSRGG
jgi:hypothetical protein